MTTVHAHRCMRCHLSFGFGTAAGAAAMPLASVHIVPTARVYSEAEVHAARGAWEIEHHRVCGAAEWRASRTAYAKALVDAQLCDAAEANRRALRTYPSPAEST